MNEIACANAQRESAAAIAGDGLKFLEVDQLNIPRPPGGERLATAGFDRVAEFILDRIGFPNDAKQPFADALQHLVDAYAGRNVVEEEYQYRNAQAHQRVGDKQRELRCKARECRGRCIGRSGRRFVLCPHRAQYDQRVDEAADKGRQTQLVAAVLHEIGQQARPVIPAGIGDRGNGDREYGRCHPDHAARHHGQHVRCTLGSGWY